MKRKELFVVAVVCAMCAATADAAYRVISVTRTDLGFLPGGSDADAYDINNRGQIVGLATNRFGSERGFMYDTGLMFDVTASTGPNHSAAFGINRDGTVVGFFSDSTLAAHAYRWDRGVLTPLAEPPSPFNVDSWANAIGDNGHIVGEVMYSGAGIGGLSVATMWTDPATSFPIDPALEADRFWSYAKDVDALGRAAGYDIGLERPWLWKPFSLPHEQVPALRAPPFDGYFRVATEPWGLHESSGVVGTMTFATKPDAYKSRAFFWDGVRASSVDLGALSSVYSSGADDINSEGFITGWSQQTIPGGGWTFAAFLFHKSFGMYALPQDKYASCKARALNDRKENGLIQVVGYCRSGYTDRAIRWNVIVEWVP